MTGWYNIPQRIALSIDLDCVIYNIEYIPFYCFGNHSSIIAEIVLLFVRKKSNNRNKWLYIKSEMGCCDLFLFTHKHT